MKIYYYEFSDEIPEKVVGRSWQLQLENHDEKVAKEKDMVTCKNCRQFGFGCEEFVGRWHKTCRDFEWS